MAILKDTIIQGNANITGTITTSAITHTGNGLYLGDTEGDGITIGSDGGLYLLYINGNNGGWSIGSDGEMVGNYFSGSNVYVTNNVKTTGLSATSISCTTINGVSVGSSPKFTDNDTKNTAGSSNSSSKLFLIGATSQQSTGTTTYSNSNVYTQSSGVYASNGFYQTSDIRKKNIHGDISIEKAYDLIDKCQTIMYTLKDNDMINKEEIGLIAQEVREFFPEIINEDENGMLSMDYSRLTVVILKVLKDIIKRISDIENKLG